MQICLARSGTGSGVLPSIASSKHIMQVCAIQQWFRVAVHRHPGSICSSQQVATPKQPQYEHTLCSLQVHLSQPGLSTPLVPEWKPPQPALGSALQLLSQHTAQKFCQKLTRTFSAAHHQKGPCLRKFTNGISHRPQPGLALAAEERLTTTFLRQSMGALFWWGCSLQALS